MSDDAAPPSGCGYLGLLSLIACLLGSALAAIVFAGVDSWAHVGSGAVDFVSTAAFVFFFGVFIAVPVGLAFGIPLMALCRRYLRHTMIMTLVFAIIGLLGGLSIRYFLGASGIGNAELIFGACVGGLHPLVYGRAKGVAWFKIIAASLLSLAVVPSLAYAGEDVGNLMDSQAEFETLCADRYGSMAVIADRTDIERLGGPVRRIGQWHNQLQWRSLYAREDRTLLDDAHVLIARDYAYVPGGFAGWITGGRRVERHCLSEKRGVDADMLRRRGFGVRPKLQNLAD